jgi:hypothetical protein
VKKILLTLLVVAASLAVAGRCFAQTEMKPVVTVSFAGYDRLMSDIGMIGELGGNPDMGKGLEMMVTMMTGGKGLAGLETKQPWGTVFQTDGKAFATVGFVPVTDLKQLVEVAKANPQLADSIELKDVVYEIRTPAQPLYMVQKGKWALISDKRENLAKASADPPALLGDLPKRYNLAVRASIQNLPKEFREQLLAQLRAGAEVGMQQMPGESADDYAVRANVAKQMVQQLTTLINDMDELLLGWNIDAKTKSTYLDVELTAQTGTKLAYQFAEIKPGKTNFAGLLLPNAAITANTVGTLSDAQVAQARANLATARKSIGKELEKQGLGKDDLKLASQLLGDMIDVVEKTFENKKTDAALAVVLDPAAVTLVAGAAIADGAKLEKAFGQLADEIKKNEDAAKSMKLSAESYEGVQLHIISTPTPDPNLTPMVGDTLEIVVGIADDKVLAAAGRDALKTLKKGIDQCKSTGGKEVPPLHVVVAVAPIAKFLAEVANDPQVKGMAMMLAGMLEKAEGKDHVTVTSTPIAQGVRVRIEFEEGLLKALGSTMGQAMGSGPKTGP